MVARLLRQCPMADQGRDPTNTRYGRVGTGIDSGVRSDPSHRHRDLPIPAAYLTRPRTGVRRRPRTPVSSARALAEVAGKPDEDRRGPRARSHACRTTSSSATSPAMSPGSVTPRTWSCPAMRPGRSTPARARSGHGESRCATRVPSRSPSGAGGAAVTARSPWPPRRRKPPPHHRHGPACRPPECYTSWHRSSASRARSTPSAPSTASFKTGASSCRCPTRALFQTPTATRRGSPNRRRCTGPKSRTTWPTCPSRLTKPCPGSSPSSAPGTSTPRGALTLAQRELLILCALATIGDTSAHSARTAAPASKRATPQHTFFPYIELPRAVAAVRAVKDL